jgi:hypothetical protein
LTNVAGRIKYADCNGFAGLFVLLGKYRIRTLVGSRILARDGREVVSLATGKEQRRAALWSATRAEMAEPLGGMEPSLAHDGEERWNLYDDRAIGSSPMEETEQPPDHSDSQRAVSTATPTPLGLQGPPRVAAPNPARTIIVASPPQVAIPPPSQIIYPGFPEFLLLGGEEEFDAYQEAFDRIILARRPIIDPRKHEIIFNDDVCMHICFRQERFDKRRKRHDGEEAPRDVFDPERARYISWILVALTDPSEIVRNTQEPGNEVYLLGSPRNDLIHPRQRYYVSVKPIKGGQRLFKTAFSIDREK